MNVCHAIKSGETKDSGTINLEEEEDLSQLDEYFNSDKVATKQTTIFLPKINKVFLSPILQNLKRREGPFWTNYF